MIDISKCITFSIAVITRSVNHWRLQLNMIVQMNENLLMHVTCSRNISVKKKYVYAFLCFQT